MNYNWSGNYESKEEILCICEKAVKKLYETILYHIVNDSAINNPYENTNYRSWWLWFVFCR